MKTFFSYILVIFTLSSSFLYSQTAEEIINKHLMVTGGIDAWVGFKSAILKGEMVLGVGESYPVSIYQQRPNWAKTVMTVQGKNVILNGYNGKKAVQFNFQTGKLESDPHYIPESFDSDLLHYQTKGFQAVFSGIEKINTSDCYKVILTKENKTTTYFFDTVSYQLIQETNASESKMYSDFKTVSGLSFPFKIEVKSSDGESDFILILKNIEVNKPISSKEFNF